MLTRIRIRNYKSLSDVEVHLKPLSVLFGPNASGKSNFLDALQLLSRIATRPTLKEAFDPPYRGTPLESFAFGTKGIRGLLEQESATFSIEVDVLLSQSLVESVNQQLREIASLAEHAPIVTERALRYRIEIEISPRSGFLRVSDEFLAALTAQGTIVRSRKPFLESNGDRLVLRGKGHPASYERLMDHSILSRPYYPPYFPHLFAIREEFASWLSFYLEPRERMRAASPVREVRHIGLMGEELGSFLNTLKTVDERQFRVIERSLRMIIPSASGIQLDVNDRGEVELRLIEGGVPVPARVLSEGTLRVLGLLALGGAKEPPALLGFEEPENGIHPRRIQLIAELLKTRAETGDTQLIVTTHSPVLLDRLPIESLYVLRKKGGRTEIQPFEIWGEIARKRETESALDAEEEPLPVSQRVLRGDLDG